MTVNRSDTRIGYVAQRVRARGQMIDCHENTRCVGQRRSYSTAMTKGYKRVAALLQSSMFFGSALWCRDAHM